MTQQDYETYAPAETEAVYVPPTARIMASYPPTPGCPDTMTVELNVDAGTTLGIDIRAAVQALAAVGVFAGYGPS